MRKLLSLLLCLLLLVALPCSVFAADISHGPIVDNADLLTREEEEKLDGFARQIWEDTGIWAAIVTVQSLDGNFVEDYAEDFYDSFYYAKYPDGVIMLIAMDTREWTIFGFGRGYDQLTDYEMDQLFFGIAGSLSNDHFYDAFQLYLERLPQYMAEAPKTEPGPWDFLRIIPIALLIGAAAGGITILVMRSQMNTAKPQRSAGNYLVNGSYQLKKHHDIFLYSRVSRTRKPQNNGGSSSRGSGGGGRGGRSGRF